MTIQRPTRGLTAAEVAERVAAGQVNQTQAVTSRPLWEIIRANVFTRFNGLLGALLVFVLATGSWADALFGLALVLNSVSGIAQEWAAKRKLDALAVLHAPTATVVRDGQPCVVPLGEVVLGDLVELRAGDQVAADGRLIASENLEVDESNLTGESDAVAKAAGDEVSSGTAVVAGHGWFTADVVGADSVAQKLAAEAKKFTRTYSEVQHSTNVLLRWITWVVIVATPLAIWSQYRAVGEDWREVVIRSAAGLVGLVPEGLVLLTTLAFLLAAVQLTSKNALVQELPAVEGLARVDVICVDKTGTLTFGDIAYERTEVLAGDANEAEAVLGALAHEEGANQTTKAIAAAVPDPGWRVAARLAFNSARKYSGADLADRGKWLLGAPDVLLSAAPAELAASLTERVAVLSDEGRRVVLLARVPSLPGSSDELSAVEPIALVELAERIRPDAEATLAFFAEQGVRLKVISGDHPRTVAAVARRVGLEVGEPVDARTLAAEPPTEGPEFEVLADLMESSNVFGRVTPAQKRAFVRALQHRGHTVAMTGDGVNDVLALKDADIGIAMGNATPASKAVAQLVLLDGRFANLPKVLAEGRRLIGNVERVANLFLAKNVMSAVAIFATAVFGAVFPFLPRQLTLVSTLTIGIPAAILALGPNTRRYLPGFLRRVLELAVPAGVAAGIVSFTAYSLAPAWGASGDVETGTVALSALLVVNFWLLAVLARPYLPWKVVVVLAMIGLAVLAYLLPVGQEFFRIAPEPGLILPALGLGAVGGVVVEVAYHLSRRPKPAELEGAENQKRG